MIRGLLRFLVFLFVTRIVLRALASLFRTTAVRTGPRPAAGPAGTPGDPVPLLRDRICNTFFPAPRAVRATIAGKEQVFCSAECAQQARVLASS